MENGQSRRKFLGSAIAAGSALFFPIGGKAWAAEGSDHGAGHKPEEDVSAVEDLMREHGALNRILLIYDEISRRAEGRKDFPQETLFKAAQLVRAFIEGYHERLEEDFIFPRLLKAGKLSDLVETLKAQHDAGRKVTTRILALSEAPKGKKNFRGDLVGALGGFVRMYRPHEAREDTVLFPAFKTVVSRKEYDELGERFEQRERELFGKQGGFEGVIDEISRLEQSLGIHELRAFTPSVR